MGVKEEMLIQGGNMGWCKPFLTEDEKYVLISGVRHVDVFKKEGNGFTHEAAIYDNAPAFKIYNMDDYSRKDIDVRDLIKDIFSLIPTEQSEENFGFLSQAINYLNDGKPNIKYDYEIMKGIVALLETKELECRNCPNFNWCGAMDA